MNTRRCAVCGKMKAVNKFGNGCLCPKTTCLDCKTERLEFVEPKVLMDVKRIIRREV